MTEIAKPISPWQKFTSFLELIRFSHTVFALPFAMLAAVLSWTRVPFRWQDFLGIWLCMVFARSAAMAFNRIVDREIDAENPRTRNRHLPAGLLALGTVKFLTLLCSIAFIVSTLLFLPNRWPLILSLPVLLFLLGYSYVKRFSSLCHYWLSTALMLSPIAAEIAITGKITPMSVSLASMVFFWVGGFDILYACQDCEYDQNAKLHSIPAKLGVANALRVAKVSHIAAIICLFNFRETANLGPLFLGGCVVVALLLIYEHSLVKPDNLSKVNVAFFNINALISIGLFLLALVDLAIFPQRNF